MIRDNRLRVRLRRRTAGGCDGAQPRHVHHRRTNDSKLRPQAWSFSAAAATCPPASKASGADAVLIAGFPISPPALKHELQEGGGDPRRATHRLRQADPRRQRRADLRSLRAASQENAGPSCSSARELDVEADGIIGLLPARPTTSSFALPIDDLHHARLDGLSARVCTVGELVAGRHVDLLELQLRSEVHRGDQAA